MEKYIKNIVDNFWLSFRLVIVMTLICGGLYPLCVTALSQLFFNDQANGQKVEHQHLVVGSRLLAQKFESPVYFWSRPSVTDYNPMSSGGSNEGPISRKLMRDFEMRKQKLKESHSDENGQPPQELLFASGSGLDPHLSPEGAAYQARRVARARHIDIDKVQDLIQKNTEYPWGEVFGEPQINVLLLNIQLDELTHPILNRGP